MNRVFREEKKFLINVEEFIKKSHQLEQVLIQDEHNGTNGYMIRSLYFDTVYNNNIFQAIVSNGREDYLGRFYGEFVSYSGGDGQALGVVLTPRHITELFCELVDLKPTDVIFDPC